MSPFTVPNRAGSSRWSSWSLHSVERWDFLREHAKTHLLFGFLVLPAGMCGISSGGFLSVLYSNGLALGLAYCLQGEHYRRNLPELVLVSLVWLLIGCVLALKPWIC